MRTLTTQLATLLLALASLTGCNPTVSIPSKGVPIVTGARPAAFYATTSSNPVVSKLSFDEIAKRVASIQSRSGIPKGSTAPILGYVFFDPLCPHCAKLTMSMMSPEGISVMNNIAWVPVGFLQEFSTLQGATLLSAPEPSLTMVKHESLVAAGNGSEFGLNVRQASQENIDKVIANTTTWRDAGATQVPFIVTKDPSGATLALYGELEGFEMAEFLSQGGKH